MKLTERIKRQKYSLGPKTFYANVWDQIMFWIKFLEIPTQV